MGARGARELRLLLVEDVAAEAALFEAVCQMSQAPFRTTHVPSGEAALEVLLDGGTRRPAEVADLVLLDLKLPGLDGTEVLRELRRHPQGRVLPVLVLSGSDAPDDIHRCYDLGANAYVAKPDGLEGYRRFVEAIKAFWLGEARLPQ